MSIRQTEIYKCDSCQLDIGPGDGFELEGGIYSCGGERKEPKAPAPRISKGHHHTRCVAKALGLVTQSEHAALKSDRDKYQKQYENYAYSDDNYGNPPRVR